MLICHSRLGAWILQCLVGDIHLSTCMSCSLCLLINCGNLSTISHLNLSISAPQKSWKMHIMKSLKKWEGLPLEIIAIGGLIYTKGKKKNLECKATFEIKAKCGNIDSSSQFWRSTLLSQILLPIFWNISWELCGWIYEIN